MKSQAYKNVGTKTETGMAASSFPGSYAGKFTCFLFVPVWHKVEFSHIEPWHQVEIGAWEMPSSMHSKGVEYIKK